MRSCVYNVKRESFIYLGCFASTYFVQITREYVRSLKSPPPPCMFSYAFLGIPSPFRACILFKWPRGWSSMSKYILRLEYNLFFSAQKAGKVTFSETLAGIHFKAVDTLNATIPLLFSLLVRTIEGQSPSFVVEFSIINCYHAFHIKHNDVCFAPQRNASSVLSHLFTKEHFVTENTHLKMSRNVRNQHEINI